MSCNKVEENITQPLSALLSFSSEIWRMEDYHDKRKQRRNPTMSSNLNIMANMNQQQLSVNYKQAKYPSSVHDS